MVFRIKPVKSGLQGGGVVNAQLIISLTHEIAVNRIVMRNIM